MAAKSFYSGVDLKKEALLNYMLSDLGMDLTQTISLPRVFLRTASIYAGKPALMEKRAGVYQPITYAEVRERAYAFSAFLIGLGLQPRQKVALWIKNSPDWVTVDLGTMFAGGVTVPIYQTLNPPIIKHILNDSTASVLVVEDAESLQKIQEMRGELSHLKHVLVRRPAGVTFGGEVHLFSECIAKGEELIPDMRDELNVRLKEVKRDDVASVIYTSGTTGNPKGVMLTHRNFLSNVYGIMSVTDMNDSDLFLSILPLSHAFERTTGYYCPLMSGACIAYAEGIKSFDKNLREVQPTVCCVVPLILEKMHDRIRSAVRTGRPMQRRIFKWALSIGAKARDELEVVPKKSFVDARKHHRAEHRHSRPRGIIRSPWLFLQHWFANWLVYRKICARIGGRMRHFVTGGAPLSAEVTDFFGRLNISIYEGYGMTETSPIISFNYQGAFKMGTTGKLLPYVQVNFSPEGEILVKGPNVTPGYYNNPEATAKVFTEDGWLHTGDLGTWDDQHFLKITGRIKELIVLCTGKNIPVVPLEKKLQQSPLITTVVMIGNDRKYITALIFPNPDEVRSLAAEKGLASASMPEILQHEEVRKVFSDLVKAANEGFAHFEQIKDFQLIDHEVEKDPELITPTLKVKRNIVEKKFMEQIEAMYA